MDTIKTEMAVRAMLIELTGGYSSYWQQMVRDWSGEARRSRNEISRRNREFSAEIPVKDTNGRLEKGRSMTVKNTVVALLAKDGKLSDMLAIDIGRRYMEVSVKVNGKWQKQRRTIEMKSDLLLHHHRTIAGLERGDWSLTGVMEKDARGHWLVLLTKHELFRQLLPTHAKRVQAGILDLKAFDENAGIEEAPALAIMYREVHVSPNPVSKKVFKTLDGAGICRMDALPDSIKKLIPITMIMGEVFTVALTTRLVSKHGGGRLAKLNLIVMDDTSFEAHAKMMGVNTTKEDRRVIVAMGPDGKGTVKNGVVGETFKAAISVHKINHVGSLADLRVSTNELFTSDYVDGGERVMSKLADNRDRFIERFKDFDTMVETLLALGEKDLLKMAVDSTGETDWNTYKVLKTAISSVAAGMPIGSIKDDILMLLCKKVQGLMSTTERGLALVILPHDGSIVDGKHYKLALPKSAIRLLASQEIGKDGVTVSRVELHDRIKELGWVKGKRSPVLFPFDCSYEEIYWLPEGFQGCWICEQFLGLISGDTDGDQLMITFENRVNTIGADEAIALRNVATKKMESLLAARFEDHVADLAQENKEPKPEDSNFFTEMVKKANIESEKVRDMYAAALAGDRAGQFSNAGLTMVCSLGDIDVTLVQTILHMANEGPIQAIKHLDRSEGFLSPRVIAGGSIDAIAYRKPKCIEDLLTLKASTGEVPRFFQPMVEAIKAIDWIGIRDRLDLEHSRFVTGVENATRKVIGNLIANGCQAFNMKDGKFFSIERVLSTDTEVQASNRERHGGENIPYNLESELGKLLYTVNGGSGSPAEAIERLRARDLFRLDMGRTIQVPEVVLCMLLRSWNATREGSHVPFFSAARYNVTEWEMLAEIIIRNMPE